MLQATKLSIFLTFIFSVSLFAQYETVHFTSDAEYEAIVQYMYDHLSFAPELRMGDNTSAGDWEQGQHDFKAGTPPYGAYRAIGNVGQRTWQSGVTFDWRVVYDASNGTVSFETKYPSESSWLVTTATTDPANRTFTDIFIRTFGNVSGTNMRRWKMWNISISKNNGPAVAVNDSSYVDTPNTPVRDYLWIKNVNVGPTDTFEMTGKGLVQWTGAPPTRSNLAAQIKLTRISDRRDYGDAPASYPAAWMTNIGWYNPGTNHYWFYIGNGGAVGSPKIDTDAANQPSAAADGDDTDADGDDEDGIVFLDADGNPLNPNVFEFIPGQTYQVQITVYSRHYGAVLPVYVKGWIDYNKNSSFLDNGESIIDVTNPANQFVSLVSGDGLSSPNPPPAQVKTISFTIPANAAAGTTFARFILTTNADIGPHGPASGAPQPGGEVEDYKLIIREAADWGDAPDTGSGTGLGNYQTKYYDNGPRHRIVSSLRLGNLIDAEYDGYANVGANGDDTNQLDDEDGLNGSLSVAVGSQPAISVRAFNMTGKTAVLSGWIDVNRNGLFENSERASALVPNGTNGFVNLIFPTISGPAGFTFARFRISTQDDNSDGHLDPTGFLSDGEVEDYVCEIALDTGDEDHGDAPSSYGDAAHAGISNNLQLGPVNSAGNGVIVNVDGELMSFFSENAVGDNLYNDNDENGVAAFPALKTNSTSYSVAVQVFNQSGQNAVLAGWIDFNRDGVFSANEGTTASVPNGTVGTVILTWNNLSGLTAGATYARFRIAPVGSGLSASTPEGLVMGGEVEDYVLQIENPIAVILSTFAAAPVKDGVLISWQVESTVQTAGFHLLRSESETGPYRRITTELIPVKEDLYRYEYLDRALNTNCYYKLEQVRLDGNTAVYGPIAFSNIQASIEMNNVPRELSLAQNYPNPFNPSTTIKFNLTKAGTAELIIYDLLGHAVKTLFAGQLEAGEHSAEWDATDQNGNPVGSGIYIYRLTAEGRTLTRRMIVIR
ncbi:MAG: GEVED domain-containing protein [candidate division KSB1 bacterium]|nr:GEVED domain-containing protein [candidate division KSB1 bacterium]